MEKRGTLLEQSKEVLINGIKSALYVMRRIAPLMSVIYLLMEVLTRTGWLYAIADFCQPAMSLCGLPGEAAIVLLLGLTNGIYGSLAAFMAIDLTMAQANILAMMVLISHNLFSEGGIVAQCGMPFRYVVITKLGLTFLLGMGMNVLFMAF